MKRPEEIERLKIWERVGEAMEEAVDLRIKEEILRSRSSFSREVSHKGHYSFLGAEEGVRALRWRRERRDRA